MSYSCKHLPQPLSPLSYMQLPLSSSLLPYTLANKSLIWNINRWPSGCNALALHLLYMYSDSESRITVEHRIIYINRKLAWFNDVKVCHQLRRHIVLAMDSMIYFWECIIKCFAMYEILHPLFSGTCVLYHVHSVFKHPCRQNVLWTAARSPPQPSSYMNLPLPFPLTRRNVPPVNLITEPYWSSSIELQVISPWVSRNFCTRWSLRKWHHGKLQTKGGQ